MRLRRLAPPLRYAAYVAVALLAFFVAAGVGAAASLVVGWLSEPGVSVSGGTPGPRMTEDTTSDGPVVFEEKTPEGTYPEGTTSEGPTAGGNTFAGDAPSDAEGISYLHTATEANSRGDYTYLDHPAVNGDPNAVVLVVSSEGSGATDYAHNVGVWYEPTKERWAIFNQDLAAVPVGSEFEVVVPSEPERFIHRATKENTSEDTSYLDNLLVNGKPDAEVTVTQNWNPGGGNGVYNDRPVGALYDVGRWSVRNEDGAPMPEGAAFNVAVSGAAPAR